MNPKKRKLEQYHKRYNRQYQRRLVEMRIEQLRNLKHTGESTNLSPIITQPKPTLEQLDKSLGKQEGRLIASIIAKITLTAVAVGGIAGFIGFGANTFISSNMRSKYENQRETLISSFQDSEAFKSAYTADLKGVSAQYANDEIDFDTYNEKVNYLNSEEYIYSHIPEPLKQLDAEIAISNEQVTQSSQLAMLSSLVGVTACASELLVTDKIQKTNKKIDELQKAIKDEEESYERFA